MTVEEIRGQNGDYDDFPVGMRVLAVDDDPICLKLLDTLLRKCQYQVTTTSRARVALKMLRENKDRFDLVISDVHMPDMDGFKLLELVGLEMDLPVIMLSANSDPKLVMKGVTHGACDYLVKPIRIEELRNIWQHVIRRKKFDPKQQKMSSDQDKFRPENVEGGQGPSLTGNADQSGKLNKKRKDDKDEAEENEHENEDPATQKKPRVVWSIELHRKFVAAVNQLGIEKAVPKRILDMMNVEGISRENVASHLQKYRLYLKRISSVATQQANRVAALGCKDSAYMRMGSLDGLGDFRALAGSGRLANTVLSPYASSGMLGRLNSPAVVNLHNLTSSPLMQPSHSQNFSNPINTFGKLPPVISPASQKENLIQGTSSLELDQLHQNKCTTRLGDFNPTDDSRIFTTASTFTDTRVAVGSLSNSLSSAPNSSVMLQENCPSLNGGGFGNQSSFDNASFNSDSFSIGVGGSADFLDPGKYNENWQSGSLLSKFQTNLSPLTEPLNNGHLLLSNVRENHSSAITNLLNPLDFSATNTVSAPVESSRRGLNCQEGFVGDVVPNLNQLQNQRWGAHKQNYSHNSNNVFSTLNSQLPANNGSQNMDQSNVIFDRKMDMSLVGRSNGDASILLRPGEIEKSTADLRMRSNEDYLLGQTKPQGAFAPHNYDCLDDVMSAMIKREQDGAMLDGQFGFDPYTFGSCM